MPYDSVKRGLLFPVLGLSLIWVQPVRAALGSDAASVLTDGAGLQGTVNSVPGQQYDIQEINAANGVRVREFLNQNGIVFAVTWSGPVVPDLRMLLGRSFDSYSKAVAALKQPGLHRSLRIATPELVVESGGHMRAYSGRAYLPLLIPAGASTADLR
jgi:Protein of unknown function (DUF2844)